MSNVAKREIFLNLCHWVDSNSRSRSPFALVCKWNFYALAYFTPRRLLCIALLKLNKGCGGRAGCPFWPLNMQCVIFKCNQDNASEQQAACMELSIFFSFFDTLVPRGPGKSTRKSCYESAKQFIFGASTCSNWVSACEELASSACCCQVKTHVFCELFNFVYSVDEVS